MFHNKPWALLAFLIIMPFVVIGTQKLGWGTSGLLISVGVAALAAALIFFTVKKIRTMYRRSFRNRGDLIAFAFGVEQQHDTALVPYGSNQQESEDYIEGETVYINEGTTGPAALPIPPEQLPENRFRLYLGSHTLDVEVS